MSDNWENTMNNRRERALIINSLINDGVECNDCLDIVVEAYFSFRDHKLSLEKRCYTCNRLLDTSISDSNTFRVRWKTMFKL